MEKIAKPTPSGNQTPPQGSQGRVNSKTPENDPSGEVNGMVGVIKPLEKKDPNSLGPQFISKRAHDQDGGHREYVFTGPVQEDFLFNEVARVLGIENSHTYQNEIADITKMLAEWAQTDNYEIIGTLIRQVLRRTSVANDKESRLHALKRKLQSMWEEERNKKYA